MKICFAIIFIAISIGAAASEGGQCPVTSLPPNPKTGCCGREASDSDRNGKSSVDLSTDLLRGRPYGGVGILWRKSAFQAVTVMNGVSARLAAIKALIGDKSIIVLSVYMPTDTCENLEEFTECLGKMSAIVESDNVEAVYLLGDYNSHPVAGKSDLEKFPWAVRLKVTFNADETAIKCGGTLISSQYVLTAGHCVYAGAEKTVMYKVEVYLAKSPKDFKNVLDHGQKCVEDVVMKAEEVILHPEYEGKQLKNDIALLRLLGAAPYTDYIRPICLPTNDVDSLEYVGLRLAVAGWGQNGQDASGIKRSAIVHVVAHEECKKYFPGLSKLQMCAVGYAGQDVCKGDDGDPLMAMNGRKYELVGILSGKREDSPCGSSIPSLYVNVYHYVDWIRNNMK